ncbi:MAG: tetratricopeptide repeat protein [Vicinamibacterales bacterium]
MIAKWLARPLSTRLKVAAAFALIAAIPGLAQEQPQTLSLLGAPLYAPPVAGDARARIESDLASAQAAFEKDPSNVDAALAAARADMALGHIGDALELLTRAREGKPDDPRLLVEAAGDLIVNRKFDAAERDARKAGEGAPGASCVLGFALYLKADYAHAKGAYAACRDPGVFAYLADRFTGGSTVPRPSVPDTPASTTPPLRLPGSLVRGDTTEKPLTAAYLDAAERLASGKRKDARDLLKRIVEKHMAEWMTPVYIAAEADYARLAKRVPRKRD